MNDTQLIAIECRAAQSEGREISDACARMIASQWHSDDIGAAFSTTGAISDPTDVYRSLFYLRGQSVYPSMTAADKIASDMLGTYLTNAGKRGPVPGWSGLWLRTAREHSGPRHADYPHEPGYLIGCPACESECHCDGYSAECVFDGEHNAKPAYCGNCGRTEQTAGQLRTRIVDFRTEYLCDDCVARHDWTDWDHDAATLTYTHKPDPKPASF